jgi:hypothetical protein
MILREELYRLVWAEPMTKVAARFEVSGSYMARVCESLNVPRPPRGHWAKLAVGKAEPAPLLPEPRASDPLGWSNDGAPIPRPKPAVPTPRARRAATRTLVPAVHTLVSGAKALILRSRPVDEGAFLKPFKRLLVDIMTSQSCLDRAVSLANELFNAFEAAGHRVALAAASSNLRRTIIDEREAGGSDRGYNHYPRLWSPDRPTIVSIGTVAIGLSVVEMSEHVTLRYVNGRYVRDTPEIAAKMARSRQYSWTTTSDVPSGRLRVVAYSPYGRVDWSRIWQEAKAKEEGIPVGPIVKAVVGHASDLIAKLAEAERQAEIEHQAWLAQQERWRRDDDRRRVEQSIQESSAALSEVIERWSRVMEIERFFQGVENRASTLASDEKAAVLERLAFAREFLGSRDPLDFFRNWRTPRERYQPIYSEEPADVVQSSIIKTG